MTTRASPRLLAYALLATLGCLTGLALERPEPVLLGAPFLLALLLGAALRQPLDVRMIVRLANDRAVEGDDVPMTIELQTAAPVARLEVAPRLPAGLAFGGETAGEIVSLAPDTPRVVERAIHCTRWGGYVVGEVFVRARDPLGFFVREGWINARHPLRVYPGPVGLQSIAPPAETRSFAGNERSRASGEGIEFASTRPFAPGDRVRRINWRLSSRLGEPYVNELHPEQNTDVVLFLDNFAEARLGDDSTRFQVVRAAAALADRYLTRRDRIGLIGFGGVLRWLTPATGIIQRYRILDSLIETDIVFSYAWKGIATIPPAVLPPRALVIAITPLLDERAINALVDLRARRFDLSIIDVSPAPFLTPPPGEAGELALRIWQLEREMMRDRFQRLGVPVTVWTAGQPLERSIREVQAFRHSTRRARA